MHQNLSRTIVFTVFTRSKHSVLINAARQAQATALAHHVASQTLVNVAPPAYGQLILIIAVIIFNAF